MSFLSRFLSRLFGSQPQAAVPDMPDAPDDLRQAAVASMQNLIKNRFEGTFLAHLSPNQVRTSEGPGRKYFLEAENLSPQLVLACWVWQGGHWLPCEIADFLAQRGKRSTKWQELGVWFTDTQATIVWQKYSQVLRNRRGGTGGTAILERTLEGWVESDEQGEGWII